MSQKADTFEIILGRVEHIDASHFNCLSFSKVSDVVNGIDLRLTNMAGGYPFDFEGTTWHDSETLYLCGEFSNDSIQHKAIQEDMFGKQNGYAAKRFIKNKYKSLIRQDFSTFRIQWMLFVVWMKCKGNVEFASLLSRIPQEAIIIEDTTKQRCETKEIWGCSNLELARRRADVKRMVVKQAKATIPNISKAALKRLVDKETRKVNRTGTFVGQNNLGKILMICRDSLVNETEPPIDYALLNQSNIYILGKQISFNNN